MLGRRGRVAGERRLSHGTRDRLDDRTPRGGAERHRLIALESPSGGLGVAGPHRGGEFGDRRTVAEAVVGGEFGDTRRGGADRGDEVGEHRTGLDARQLVGISDEDHPGGTAEGVEERCRQRERHHRRLIDDDDVVVQRIGSVMAEGGTPGSDTE